MNDDEQLRDRLRSADPAAHLAPAAPGHVDRLLEDTMSTNIDHLAVPPPPPPDTKGPRVLPWIAAVAAAVIVAAVGFGVLDHNEPKTETPMAGKDQTTTALSLGGAQGRCIAPDPITLAQAELAFQGTVTGVAGGVVTLQPSTWYAGDHTDLVTVKQADPGMSDLIGTVDFQQGKDYFVAANKGQVMVCGFSGEKSSDLGSLYQQAFSGNPS